MVAPRHFSNREEDDDVQDDPTEQQGSNHRDVNCRNNSNGYYVEENEPPPVYDPAEVAVPASAASASTANHHENDDDPAVEENEPPPTDVALVSRHVVDHNNTSSSNNNRKPGRPKCASASDERKSKSKSGSNNPNDDNADNGDDFDPAFVAALKRLGLEIAVQEGDGNCLFRSVSLQVYGDAEMHGQVRAQCLDFMASNAEHFAAFCAVTTENDGENGGESFDDYIARKRRDGVHGNNPEIQALSELFNRPVEVYATNTGGRHNKNNNNGVAQHNTDPVTGKLRPLNIFQNTTTNSSSASSNDVHLLPIRLSYHDGNHYNAVVDPLVPTAGLGLGLPGLQPGLADQMQLASAKAESDHAQDLERAVRASQEAQLQEQDDALQRALKESSLAMDAMYHTKAMALSDVDATNLELEQAIVESSLQSWLNAEQGRKKRASPVGSARSRRRQQSPQHQQQQQRAPSPPREDENQSAFAPSSSASAAASSVARAASSPVAHAAAAASSASVASAPVAAAAAAAASTGSSSPDYSQGSFGGSMAAAASSGDEYPPVVQELVMNGFELSKVVRAYELVGDDIGDLFAFLMSNTG